jgi:hypothetical protein
MEKKFPMEEYSLPFFKEMGYLGSFVQNVEIIFGRKIQNERLVEKKKGRLRPFNSFVS